MRRSLFAALIAVSLAQPLWAAPAGKVTAVRGQVSYRESGTAAWSDARKGQAVPEGAELKTAGDSHCEVGFTHEGRAAVRLQPSTHVSLVSVQPVRLDLIEGRVYTLVRDLKKGSEFKIAAPTAIATVRGTGWEQSAYELLVYESMVSVQGSAGDTREVPQEKGIDIGEDGSLGELRDLTPEQIAYWKEFAAAALSGLDRLEASEDAFEIGQFDPAQDVMAAKDEFDELNDFEDAAEDPDPGSGGTTTGGTTGGTNG